jgi:hypothetical protein
MPATSISHESWPTTAPGSASVTPGAPDDRFCGKAVRRPREGRMRAAMSAGRTHIAHSRLPLEVRT